MPVEAPLRAATAGLVLLLAACGEGGQEPGGGDAGLDAHDGRDGDTVAPVDVQDADSGTSDVPALPLEVAFVRPAVDEATANRVTLEASVSGGVPERTVVRFYVGDRLLRVDSAPPYVGLLEIDGLPDGPRTLRAEAESDGVRAEATRIVYVDRVGPDLALIEPGGLTWGPSPTTGLMRIEVSAADPQGVARVELHAPTLSEDTVVWDAPPYTANVPLDNANFDDTVRFDVIAYDAVGNPSRDAWEVQLCDFGLVLCGNVCVPAAVFDSHPRYCGGCFTRCEAADERCVSGECACAPGLVQCGDGCASLAVDPQNCGACGAACAIGDACVLGACVDEVDRGMVAIEAGVTAMGPSLAERDFAGSAEFELIATLTRPYLLDVTEVTQGEWDEYFEVQPSWHFACGPDCPVDSVTWYDALAFANARSARAGLEPCYIFDACNGLPPGNGFACEGVTVNAEDGDPYACEGYRLPTEAEWERAYRAGAPEATYAGDLFGFGCDANPHIDAIAWHSCNSQNASHPVGSRAPNTYGIYDMSGNVFEWTWDTWRSQVLVLEETDPVGGTGSPERAFRGGSFREPALRARAAVRLSSLPTDTRADLGFRLARTLPSTP